MLPYDFSGLPERYHVGYINHIPLNVGSFATIANEVADEVSLTKP